MSRTPVSRASRVRRSVGRAGLIVSVAGASASLAAQAQRTGWEDVKPTGWPGQATAAPTTPTQAETQTTSTQTTPTQTTPTRAAAPASERSETVVSTAVRARSSKATRRKARPSGGRRTAPAWITLEWDAPPPVDIALDWGRPPLDASPVALIVRLPESPATRAFVRESLEPAVASETAAVAEEARLPVATMIHASAPAPATPRARSLIRRSDATPRPSGFRAFMTRVADALGMRRTTAAATAPRVASAEGADVQ